MVNQPNEKNFWSRVVYTIFHIVFGMLFFSKKDRDEMIRNVYMEENDSEKYDSRIKELFLSSNTFLLSFMASILIICLPFAWLTFIFKWVDYMQLPLFLISLPLAILYFLYGVKEHHVKKLKKLKAEINFDSFLTRIHNIDMLFFLVPFFIVLFIFLTL